MPRRCRGPAASRLRALLHGAPTQLHHRALARPALRARDNTTGPHRMHGRGHPSCVIDSRPLRRNRAGPRSAGPIAGGHRARAGRTMGSRLDEGELYVGGAGRRPAAIANRPDLTAPALRGRAGTARACTARGDRVRRLAGRRGWPSSAAPTNQVEDPRLSRLELDEIVAAASTTHPGVQASAVRRARPGADGEPAGLVAYPRGRARTPSWTPSALSATPARSALPDYMLPSVFVPIDELPLMASGKVDRGPAACPPEGRGAAGGDPEVRGARANPVERAASPKPGVGVAGASPASAWTTISFCWAATRCFGTQLIARLRASFGVGPAAADGLRPSPPVAGPRRRGRARPFAPRAGGVVPAVSAAPLAIRGRGAAQPSIGLASTPEVPGEPLPASTIGLPARRAPVHWDPFLHACGW